MSDTSEETVLSDVNSDNICRDFARGVCERKFCKFKHEFDAKQLSFCHDFQNYVCQRGHCKFIHCSAREEEEFKLTGKMSCQILVEATRKNQLPGALPVCNRFQKGQCRGLGCQFRHVTKEQEEAEIRELVQSTHRAPVLLNNNNNVNETHLIPLENLNGCLRRTGVSFDEYQGDGLPLLKRRLVSTPEQEFVQCDVLEANGVGRPVFKGYFAGNPPSPMLSRVDARTIMLEEENSLLHKEIARLKKQVSDLTATNEFLLDQNANLRVSGKRNGAAVGVPAAVTIAAANAAANPRQQPQQVNGTVIASVATVPVSLATVSTCNPVSGNHSVSIAGCPAAVSIASPGQILANSQQILVTTNPSTQLAIANSSQAQLAIAQQNLANNLAQQAAQAQPQLTTQQAQHQQLALAATTTQQLTSQQAQHMANHQQQLALATQQPQQLTTQTQQQMALAASSQQAQQLQALATTSQQLTSQAQQLALASTTQQLTSQAQQLALATTNQQLTSQAQQLAMAATTTRQLAVTSVPQQLALASTNQQLIAQQNLASELHRNNQMNAIATSQAIAMSNASQPMVSYPIMTQSISHALTH